MLFKSWYRDQEFFWHHVWRQHLAYFYFVSENLTSMVSYSTSKVKKKRSKWRLHLPMRLNGRQIDCQSLWLPCVDWLLAIIHVAKEQPIETYLTRRTDTLRRCKRRFRQLDGQELDGNFVSSFFLGYLIKFKASKWRGSSVLNKPHVFMMKFMP